MVLVLVLVIGGVLGILVLNTKIAENAFRLAALEKTGGQLNQQEQQLEQDLEERNSPGNLEAQARRLGLVPSGKRAYLRLPDGRQVEVPQPASGEPSVTSQTGGR
jgi:cell division protein FtsB